LERRKGAGGEGNLGKGKKASSPEKVRNELGMQKKTSRSDRGEGTASCTPRNVCGTAGSEGLSKRGRRAGGKSAEKKNSLQGGRLSFERKQSRVKRMGVFGKKKGRGKGGCQRATRTAEKVVAWP